MVSSAARARSRLGALWQEALRGRSSRTVGLLSGISGLALVLAIAREIVTAHYFGASAELDAFLVAFTAPQMIGAALASALVSVGVPEYIQLRESDGIGAARHMARRRMALVLVVAGGVSIALAAFASPVIGMLAPGLGAEQRGLARALLVVLSATIVLYGVCAVSQAVLNANRSFWRPALQGGTTSALVVLSCALLARWYGVWAMAVGTLAGLAIALAIQATHRESRALWGRRVGDVPARAPLGPLVLVLGGTIVSAMHAPVDRWFASRFAAGTISQLNYATRLVNVPGMLLITPAVTLLLPLLSECIVSRDASRLRRVSFAAAGYCFAVCVPAVFILVRFNSEVVHRVLGRGRFDAAAAAGTSDFVRTLAPLVLLGSLTWGLMQFVLAARRYDLHVYAYLAWIVAKVILASLFVSAYGANGLPLSTVGAYAAALPVCLGLATVAHKRALGRGRGAR